ncbi:MAG: hypothetical protein JXC32_04580 [Anaerolineae bacterium]|nr:hypothetical protein [Anaerolineae bacterium]
MISDEAIVFEITVAGILDATWSDWLDGLDVISGADCPSITVLTGRLDQPALRGVLNRLWDLNLTLISVLPHQGGTRTEGAGGSHDT